MAENELALEVCRDYEHMSRDRGLFESYWDDIAAVVWPNMRSTFRKDDYKSPGDRNNQFQMDSTPQLALHRFAAILTSLLTPPNQKWHYIRSSLPELNRQRRVAEWFEAVNDALFRYRDASDSNFKGQNRLTYAGIGAFGSSTLFIDPLKGQPGIRYKNVQVGETFFRENHQGQVDTVLRVFKLTARQIVQKTEWRDVLPEAVTNAAKSRPDESFQIFHRVRPRSDHDPEAVDERSLPFESIYVLERGKIVLETGGYNTMPYAVSRYDTAPGEVYGRSPAMQAFPAIRTLMAQKRVILTQGHRAVNPVLLTSDDGVLDVSLRPGSIVSSAINTDGRPLVQTLPVGDVQLGREMMQDERDVINDTFLVSLFQILVETPDRMTATQVLERAQEKGQLLAPTVGQQHDYLGQAINREIDILARQHLIPPLPPELAEASGDYTIQYDNPLTRAARAGEAAGMFRVLESFLPIIQTTGDPTPLDNLDVDVAFRESMDINSVPVRWQRTVDGVQAIRQDRQQQQQAAQQAQLAPDVLKAAAAAKKSGLTAEDLQQ